MTTVTAFYERIRGDERQGAVIPSNPRPVVGDAHGQCLLGMAKCDADGSACRDKLYGISQEILPYTCQQILIHNTLSSFQNSNYDLMIF